jgi:hypothetical protein
LFVFSIIVVPASRAGLGAMEYVFLMVCKDTNYGNKTVIVCTALVGVFNNKRL